MRYRDPHTDLDSGRKISWVTKQAGVFSPLTSSMGNAAHMRLATPRPTGKIPGMGGQAKNPFNAMQKVKAPKEPSIPKMASSKGGYIKEIDDPSFGMRKPKNMEEMYGVEPEFKSRKERNEHKKKVVRSELHDARLYSNIAGALSSRKARVARHKRLKKYKHDSKLDAMREGFFPTGEKTAGYSHAYYMANRQKIKLRNKRYRMANRAKIKMARKRYQRELKAGSRRKATRIRSGTQYLSYGGF